MLIASMQQVVYWDAVCGAGEPFWDYEVTWNTTAPDFPDCFKKTVLAWIPCVVLWFLSPLEIYNIVHSKFVDMPVTILTTSKLIICLFLVALNITKIISLITLNYMSIMQSLDLMASLARIVTLILVFVLTWKGRRRGTTTSGTLMCFWFIFFLSDALICICSVLTATGAKVVYISSIPPTAILEIIYFLAVVIQFCLSLLSDASPCDQAGKNKEERSSVVSRIFYIWYDRLALLGYQRPLEIGDLGNLKFSYSCAGIVDKFNNAAGKFSQSCRSRFESDEECTNNDKENLLQIPMRKSTKLKPFLKRSILEIFGSRFMIVLLFKLSADIVSYSNPLVLHRLVRFMSSGEPNWHGYGYAFLFAAIITAEAVFSAHFAQNCAVLGLKIRTALTTYIYKKALRLSNNAKAGTTIGEIVNLMSVDIHKIVICVDAFAYLVSTPLQVVIGMVELYVFMGPSSLVGIAFIALFQGITIATAMLVKKSQVIFMKLKDQRIKAISEVLSGIKVLKLFAWEDPYERNVEHLRNKELKQLIKIILLSSVNIVVWASSQATMLLVVFAVFILTDEQNVLDSPIAFVALMLLHYIRRPLMIIPSVVITLVEGAVSMKRLNRFSFYEELHQYNEPLLNLEFAVQIQSGTFSWLHNVPPVLSDINLDIPKGSLVAIVGSVGSGKSSLLSAMLGELNRLNGKVAVEGKIAYGAQIPWIQNATIKDNVLFGIGMEDTRYKRVLQACALLPDLEMLPGGDMTEIGEQGINLSGGQKQRVSLARAVYFDASTYLLDDPLSAVDVYVGKHIFNNVIGPNGLLKNKTRVLVTHSLTYLPEVDYVVVLNNGTISEIGTYQELTNRRGPFSEFINIYANNSNSGCDQEEFKKISLDERKISEEVKTFAMKFNQAKKAEVMGKLVEKESVEVGKVKLGLYLAYMKAQSWCAIVLVLTQFAANAFRAETTLWLKDWSNDEPIENVTENILQRNYRLEMYAVFSFCYVTTFAVYMVVLAYGSIYAARHFHSQLLKNVIRARQCFFNVTPVGRILNRFSSDIAHIDVQLPMSFKLFVHFSGQFIVALAIIIWKMPLMAIVVAPIAVMFYVIQSFSIYGERHLHRLNSATKSPIYSLFSESLNGSKTIRAYKKEKYFFNELKTKVDKNTICHYMSTIAQRWQLIRIEILGAILLFSASAFAAAGREKFDPGTIGLVISHTITITDNLKFIFKSLSGVQTSIVSLERVNEYSKLPQEGTQQQINIKKKWLTRGAIEFKGYSATYRIGLDTVLKDITCSVRGGEKLGVVGRTGAGKTSLILALFRIIEPVDGDIFIDDVDINTLDLHDLRKNLTLIPQDPVLFSGTIRMNLDPFDSFSDETVWESLKLAHLKEFISNLPSQLDYCVSEGGENLSVGQRQLICLARALLKKTKILILDEATAAIDLETDALIQATIRHEFSNSTVVTIAHRINTIMDNDRIMVLDKGRIVEFDTTTNLLNNASSIFHGMAKDAELLNRNAIRK